MIVKKFTKGTKVNRYGVRYSYEGWYLFGVIPLYVIRTGIVVED